MLRPILQCPPAPALWPHPPLLPPPARPAVPWVSTISPSKHLGPAGSSRSSHLEAAPALSLEHRPAHPLPRLLGQPLPLRVRSRARMAFSSACARPSVASVLSSSCPALSRAPVACGHSTPSAHSLCRLEGVGKGQGPGEWPWARAEGRE